MILQAGLGVTGKLSWKRSDTMNPVVGLDVSKGESQVQAFLDEGQSYGKSFSISNTREGLDTFLHFLKNAESITGQ